MIVLFISLSCKIDVDFSVTAPCMLKPSYEWILALEGQDLIRSSLVTYGEGAGKNFRTYQFDRRDFVELSIDPTLNAGSVIDRDRVVARINSMDNFSRIAELSGELVRQEEWIKVLSTGMKENIRLEAEQNLQKTLCNVELAESNFLRIKALYEAELVSPTEYEEVEADMKLARFDASIARAHLESTISGEKAEILAEAEAGAEVIKLRIEAVRDRIAEGSISTPFSGIVTTTMNDTVLCRISKIDTLVAVIPVSQSNIRHLAAGQHADLSIAGFSGERVEGKLVRIDLQATHILGNTYFLAGVEVVNGMGILKPGAEGKIKIGCGKVKLARWILEKMGISSFHRAGLSG